MDRNEIQFDKIESYLRGEMQAAEAADFERQISADPGLKTQVDMQRLEHDAMEMLVEDKLRARMKRWKEENSGNNANKRGWWFWGGAILIMTTAAVVYWNYDRPELPQPAGPKQESPAKRQDIPVAQDDKNSTSPPQQPTQPPVQQKPAQGGNEYLALADEAYSLAEDLNLRTGDDDPDSPLDKGIQAFEDENFKKAIRELSPLGPEIGEDYYDRARELLGHAYFRDRQFGEAARIFEQMANDREFLEVRQYGEWYLTLALLPNYDSNRSRVTTLLKNMTGNPRHTYHKQAVDLQEKLGRVK